MFPFITFPLSFNSHDLTNFPTLTTDRSSLVSSVSLWWNFFIYITQFSDQNWPKERKAARMFLDTKWYFSCHEAQSVNDHATFNFIREKQRKTLLVSTTLWNTIMKNEVVSVGCSCSPIAEKRTIRSACFCIRVQELKWHIFFPVCYCFCENVIRSICFQKRQWIVFCFFMLWIVLPVAILNVTYRATDH